MRAQTVPADCPLRPRQFECLQLKAFGLTRKQIGLRMGISESTVRTHLHEVYVGLGVPGWSEAVTVAVRRGWMGFIPRTAAQPESEDPPLSPAALLYLEGLDRVLRDRDPSGHEAMDLGMRAITWRLGHEPRRHRHGPGGLLGDLIRDAIDLQH